MIEQAKKFDMIL